MKIYVARNGQQFGPYTVEQAREYLAIGRLRPDDVARRQDMDVWDSLSNVLAKPLPRKGGGVALFIGLSAALLLAGALFIGVSASRSSGGAPAPEMNASVRQSALGVTVTNGSSHPYEDVTVKINYSISGSGEYSARVARINVGEAKTIPYSEFTDSSNNRFSYAATKVGSVMVRAKVGGTYNWQEFGG